MQYVTKAFAMRWPEDTLARAKEAAAESGTSLTAYVLAATETRLGAPSLLEQPMVPLQPTSDTMVPRGAIAPKPNRPIERPVTPFRVDPKTCAHPWRDRNNQCRSCGHQR